MRLKAEAMQRVKMRNVEGHARGQILWLMWNQLTLKDKLRYSIESHLTLIESQTILQKQKEKKLVVQAVIRGILLKI